MYKKRIIHIFLFYFMWITLHYTASHLYSQYCTPANFIGFLISPFLSENHFCSGLRWCINNGSYFISNMWIIIGSCITTILMKYE